MTQGWPSSRGSFDSFDDIFNRFFGSGMSRQPPVQRIDLRRLLSESAKQVVEDARKAAHDWGSTEITPNICSTRPPQTSPPRASSPKSAGIQNNCASRCGPPRAAASARTAAGTRWS